MSPVLVRDEAPADVDAIRDVVTRAFEQPAEAALVDALRRAGKATISLVAEQEGRVVGHVLFSPVTLAEAPHAPFASGLAPLAVLPEMQRHGIGGALVRAGPARCPAARDPACSFGPVKASMFSSPSLRVTCPGSTARPPPPPPRSPPLPKKTSCSVGLGQTATRAARATCAVR